jgi:FkbM family methyltransferase
VAFYRPAPTCQIARLAELYEAVFGQRADGTFVEVGAFDGDTYSNTSCLADLGWRGLYIEPVPRFAEICRWRHRDNARVSVVECAVGATPGRATIQIAHSFSSMHAETIEQSKAAFRQLRSDEALVPFEAVFAGETAEVAVVRLDDLLARHGFAPGFDVLVVDVEGHEAEVFASFDLAAWRPRLVIAELMDLHHHHVQAAAGTPNLRSRILAAGYEHLHVDAVNTVFERID